MVKRLILMLALFALPAAAAVETTTVQGKVYVLGAPATGGTVTCQLSASGTADDGGTSQRVLGRIQSSISAVGAVSFALVPNDAITPTGTYYTCRIKTTGPETSSETELWSVTTSPDPVDIGSITRLEVPPGLTVGDFLVYVSTEPSGACTTADVPTFAEDTDTICECVASTWSCSALGASTFDGLGAGTNTTAAMVVGTGASISATGSGAIAATTAAELAANPANCSAGQFPLGVAASGAAESCGSDFSAGMTALAVNGMPHLSQYADSGAGSSADPWVVSATGWDQVKGGAVYVGKGFYETAHGAELDVSDGTKIYCDGARWNLPPEVRTSTAAMLLIDDTATVEIHGCRFGPGVSTPDITGPCPHRSDNNLTGTDDTSSGNTTVMTDSGASFTPSALIGRTIINLGNAAGAEYCVVTANDATTVTCSGALSASGTWDSGDDYVISLDTAGGTSYIKIGTEGTAGSADVLLEDVYFESPRAATAQGGRTIALDTGVDRLVIRNVTSDVTNTFLSGIYRDDVVDNAYDSIVVTGFHYNAPAYTNKTCGKTQPVFDFDQDGGAGNDWSFGSFSFKDSLIDGADKFMELDVDGDNFMFQNNHGIGEFFDGWFGLGPPNGIDFAHVSDNSCYDLDATTQSQGCEVTFNDTAYVSVVGNHWRSRGNSPMIVVTGSNNLFIDGNYIDTRNNSAGSLSAGVKLGTVVSYAHISNNVVVDATDLVEFTSGATLSNITVVDNILQASSNNNYLYYIIDTDAVSCSNCYAANNHMIGDDGTQGDWIDDATIIGYALNNTYQADWTTATYAIPNTTSSFGGNVSWTADHNAAGGSALAYDNSGITSIPAVVVKRDDANATTVDASANAGGAIPWTDPTNAYGMDLTTYSTSGTGTSAYQQFYRFTGSSDTYSLEVAFAASGSGHNNGGTFSVKVCSAATTTGAHDGAGDAAALTDSGEAWTVNAFVGATISNTTDGSTCVVTANTATTVTCTLTGGAENDWDAADAYSIDSCDPTTDAGSSTRTTDYPAGIERIYHYFGTADPDDVVVMIDSDNAGGTPAGARYQARVYGVQLTTASLALDVPDAAISFIGSGAFPLAVCNPPAIFIDTDETDDTTVATTNDNAILFCTATDTWTVVEDD